MALFLTMTFDTDDPELHAHFTRYAQDLDAQDPPSMAVVLARLEDALETYRTAVNRARTGLERRLAQHGGE